MGDHSDTSSIAKSNGHGESVNGSVDEQVPDLPEYLHTALKQLAPKEGFTEGNFTIAFDFGSSKGDGFVGQMFKATISEGDRMEVYLCKIPPLDDDRREQFYSMTAFAREVLVYDRFIPTIYEYQRKKGILSPEDGGFFHTPRCYYAQCDEAAQQSVIIMEDLRLREFQLWNKHKIIDYDHATLFMTQLGRFHAISLAMKRDQPELFEQFKLPNPFDPMLKADGPFRNMVLSQLQMVIDALDEQDTIGRAKMEQLKEEVFDELQRCGTAQLAEPYTVVGHGDCWTNNMMFRYKDGKPQELIFFDWQVMRYVTPVQDIVYFIFCCTDGEFRRKYYDEMIDIYHRSLSTMLAKLQHDASELFPRAALDEQLRVFGRYGILMGMFLVPMMCTRNEELPDIEALAHKMAESQQLNESFFKTTESNQDAYTTRMRANQTPNTIKLIDWQLSRYASPVLDLVYFIFNCTDEELRSHSYQRLLSIYYNSLSEHLHNLGGNVERQFPRSAFRDQLKQFGRYGLLMSMMVLPIICTPNDELPDTDTAMEGFMNDMTNGNTEVELVYGTTEKAAIRYKKRMSGCIRDAIRFGYI
uniref:CHK kinase-like domain-containing protein n=1 Tax=Anopheles culicifacies TaxID=139723 RepID=A0A182M5W7_9DIPT